MTLLEMFCGKLLSAILDDGCIKATKYVSERYVIKATRRRYKTRQNKGNVEVLVTAGKPNYMERKFIKLLKKSNEKFPVRKIQLKIGDEK